MAHIDRPAYLGRLNMRYAKRHNPASSRRSMATLQAQYKDTSNIRSKYKGNRGGWWGGNKTSGIPIFGHDDATDRADWSVGHVAARNALSAELLEKARQADVSLRDVSAENSHALGHGDYGTDHELSAPAASKAQNTEQLAIELGMREAARRLNEAHGLGDGESLVHAKVTDVLHPQTGRLLVRRFKLIRKADRHDRNGTVVFDHLMDGERLHISKDDAYAIGRRAHDALMRDAPREAGRATPATWRKRNMPVRLGGRGARKGMGGVRAPSRRALKGHQEAVLDQLQARQRRLRGRRHVGVVRDRQGVEMVGPAFTDARFPHWGNWWPTTDSGQAALSKQRSWMADHVKRQGETAESLESSGSLPAGDEATLMKHLGILEDHFSGHLGGVAHGVDHHLDQHVANAADLAAQIEGQFDEHQLGVDRQRSTLLDSTNRAVAALRRLEAEGHGSGQGLMNPDQMRLLKAAHIYRGNLIEENSPVLS